MSGLARTPCVGKCSTTFGDLVCRGCKRFVHEVVHWNSYPPAQRQRVLDRLASLRTEAVLKHVVIVDATRLREQAGRMRIQTAEGDVACAYRLLQLGGERDLEGLGLAVRACDEQPPGSLADAIEAEFLLRSQAHYESSFKVLSR